MAGNVSRLPSLNISSRPKIPILQTPRTPSSSSFHEHPNLDPLLADLSPSSILKAFRDVDNPPQNLNPKAKSLADSIAEASAHDRALGIRAALAGKRVRDWVVELQGWNWSREAFQTPTDTRQYEYWGSLPSQVVLQREERLERIEEGLALLETEDLKNHVRNIHLHRRPRAIPEPPGSPNSPTTVSYDHLPDFHVIVTAVITQTLPELMTLTRLIGDWLVRISVLKRVPSFSQQLRDAGLALESAWTTVEQATETGNGLVLTRNTYEQIERILESRVTTLARTIDAILDTLEGHRDRIPDQWIDDVEEVESDYKNWVVEAERLVQLYEWQTSEAHLEAVILAALAESAEELNPEDVSSKELMGTSDGRNLVVGLEDEHVKTEQLQDIEALPITPDTISKAPLTSIYESDVIGSSTDAKDITLEHKSVSGLLPPVSFQSRENDNAGNDFNNYDTPLLSQSRTKIVSFENEPLQVTPPSFGKSHRRADSSPLDSSYTLLDSFDSLLRNATLDSPTRNKTPLVSRTRATSEGAKYQPHVGSADMSIRSHAPSSPAEIIANIGVDNLMPDQKLFSELSPNSQIEKAQQELDKDTEQLPIGNTSPSLMVRKVRVQNNNNHSTQLTDDKITAKISRLLKKIPAPIQLTDHSSQATTEPGTEGKSSVRTQQQTLPASGLTLSPVAAKTRNTQLNDLGVRVYHLHQSGREVPIKLFIRLVGNEERVMVRVGGGWADLAEYLKEYAIHHGRRSVSNNNFELAGSSPAKAAANSIFNAARSPTSSPATTPVHRPVTPSHSSAKETSTSEITGLAASPEFDQSYRSRARSTSPLQEDEISALGLGGPKSKNIELSPQKRAWVDGMLGQARQLSSEHRKIDEIGDLGKVGSTKRVFLRATGDLPTSK